MKYFFATIVVLLTLSIGLSPTTSADSKEFNFVTGCTDQIDASFTAIQDITTTSNVYVKLPTRGQKLPVSVFTVQESLEGGCKPLGNISVNGDTWTKVGSVSPSDARMVIEVVAPALAGVPDANRPAVMLLDANNPICDPKKECNLIYNDLPAYIIPPSTLNDQTSLTVSQPIDPDTDQLIRVDYFVDGQRVYSTKQLEEFDTRFVSYDSQLLLRVAKYSSGQEVVYPTPVPDGFSDSFANFIFRTLNLHSIISKIIVSITSLILCVVILVVSIKIFSNRNKRMVNRNLIVKASLFSRLAVKLQPSLERYDRELANSSSRFMYKLSQQKQLFKYIAIFWLVPIVVIGGYYTIKNQVVAVYKVSGESMTNTLQDKQSLLVYKLPQSLAQLDGRQMELRRGDVVVANVVYGTIAPEDVPLAEHTIVKRVLALPGERIVIANGKTTVYSKDYPEGREIDADSEWSSTMITDPNPVPLDVQLGADELFLSGDNRPGSVDSRVNGPIKTSQVVGRVIADW